MKAWLIALALWPAAAAALGSLAPLEAEPGSARIAALGGAALGLDLADGWELEPSALADAPAGWSVGADQGLLALDLQRQGLRAQRRQGQGAWGLRLSHLGFGAVVRRDDQGQNLGSFEPRRLGVGAAYGRPLGDGLSLGSGVSALHQDLGGEAVQGALAGLSLRYRRFPWSRAVLALQASTSGFERLALGTAFQSGPLLAVGQVLSEGATSSWQAGLERRFGPVAMRFGWRQGLDGSESMAGLSAGGGFAWGPWRLDYAWQSLGALGQAHRLSLDWIAPAPLTAPAQALQETEPLPPPIGEPQALTESAQPALELEFRLPPSPVERAYQAEAQGDQAAAQARFEEALRLDPKDTRAWMGLGQLAYQRGDLDTAIQCFEQVLRLNPAEEALRTWLDQVRARRTPPIQK